MSACWTCRLRQVSCDRKRLRCQECEECGLVCEGYGPKPLWIDGGQVQQDYVECLKRIANYNTKRKARDRQGPSIDTDNGDEDYDDEDDESNDDDHDDRDDDDGDGCDGDGGDDQQAILLGREDQFSALSAYSADMTTSDSKQSDDGQDSTLSAEQMVLCGQPDVLMANASPALNSLGQAHLVLTDSTVPVGKAYLPPQSTPAIVCTCHELSCGKCFQNMPLLLRFALESPFYGDDRGWFQLLIMKSELVRCSSLALAHCWSLKLLGSNSREARGCASMEAWSYSLKTLAMLQEQLKTVNDDATGASRTNTLKMLVSTINIILFQAFEDDSEWHIHLKAGIDLLHARIGHEMHMIVESDVACSALSIAAQKFIVSTFVWLDILSATLFWDDEISRDHTALLAQFQANDTSYIAPLGCKGWVVAVIHQANQLRRWRDLMISQGSLSNILLVSRASQLQNYIDSQLGNAPSESCDESYIATYIYAQAAAIYVHVLVSGSHPDIPEIRYTVERCVPAIEKAAQLRTTPWLAWALCVIGCMAAKDLRATFETTMQRFDQHPGATLGYTRALATMRECWRLRDANTYPVHWASAMQSLGNVYLLL